MSASILFELFNMTVPAPTGIATYSRHVVRAARELGFAVDGLFHTYSKLDRRDDILAEVGFFDARNRKISPFAKYIELNWRWMIGAPRGFRPGRLPLSGVVIDARGSESDFANFRNAYALRLFNDIARYHFLRYGSCAVVHTKAIPTVFHTTQAIPLRVRGAANVYTIHDIVPLRMPYSTLDHKKFFLNMVRHLGRTADHIITVSEASRRDLIEICGVPKDRITNTYQSVAFPEAVLAPSDDEIANFVQQAFDLEYRGYFLFYGALEPKKNIARLIDGHLASGTSCPLVIAGSPAWEYESDLARIEEAQGDNYRVRKGRILRERRIQRLGYLSLPQLVALIRGAKAVVFPSLYEGFGLPVIESMLLGTPVLTSDVAALEEVAGDAAVLVKPHDVDNIAKGIRRLDQDQDLREELTRKGKVRAAQFSPKEHQRRLAAVYKSLGVSVSAAPSSSE
ncbi:MAG: glycosyltransferase family 1 protein [Methylovirgula sp.]|uniref:glycosyltransferase family 4 protein n=1 Tax=Methylovirgula sp. TaxID=1978224 RepID=UPI00307638F5